MQDLPYDTEDAICALATPWSPSALAVIRTTGVGCIQAFRPFFSRPEALIKAPGNTALHGRVLSATGETLDDVVVTVFRAPASSTGQDTVEGHAVEIVLPRQEDKAVHRDGRVLRQQLHIDVALDRAH